MRDERLKKTAELLCDYSLELKENQNLLVRGGYLSKPLMIEILKYANSLGVNAYFDILDDELTAASMIGSKESRYLNAFGWAEKKYKEIDAFITLRATENAYSLSKVPSEIRKISGKINRPLSNIIVNEKKWVLLDYPTRAMAQNAKMPYEEFYDFVMDVCNTDYKKMNEDMQPLKELMDKTDKVRIVSPGTDVSFSIKGIPSVICSGENNVPDGELFTAPVKGSVNGTITYNAPSPQSGTVFNNVSLTVKDGKIISATADNEVEKLNENLDLDEGARFFGEFAIGVNNNIKKPIGNILFDEKIGGSIHFTPGQAYEEADNGNRSALHWDLVLIQKEDFGGGEIYFDDKLIRKDGLFVLPELKNLNWK